MMRCAGIRTWVGLAIVAACAAGRAPGQEAGEQKAAWDRPTENGIRLTPDIARAIAEKLVEGPFAAFGLSEEDHAAASEAIARRIMQTAHAHEADGQAFFEYALESLFRTQGSFDPQSGQKWAELNLPLIPALRQLCTNIAEDIRPMIPPKQLPKFMGAMLALSTGIDAYEQKMTRWASGDIAQGEDPFRDRRPQEDADESGENRIVRYARERAENTHIHSWDQIVEQTIAYYALDERQQTTAHSILEEIKQRGKAVMTDEWRAKLLFNRMQVELAFRLPGRRMQMWRSPWRWKYDLEYRELMKPIENLTKELRRRLEEIPTQTQREAAAARMRDALSEYGV
jgi:hypothetical protein